MALINGSQISILIYGSGRTTGNPPLTRSKKQEGLMPRLNVWYPKRRMKD